MKQLLYRFPTVLVVVEIVTHRVKSNVLGLPISMTEDTFEYGEPVARLIRLIGIKTEEDQELLKIVSVHDMSVIYTQLEFQSASPAELWGKLRKTLIARKKKIEEASASLSAKLEALEERKARKQKKFEDEAKELASSHKAVIDQIGRNERALERDRDDFTDEEYENKKMELAQQREEELALAATRSAELERNRAVFTQEMDASLKEVRDRLEEVQGSKQSQRALWDAYAPRFTANTSISTSLDHSDLSQFAPLLYRGTGESSSESLSFTPKCENCGAKFEKPPPDWFCPTCLSKRHRHRVWQVETDAIRCMVCLTAPIARFSRHHCRSCGRVVCSRCCSQRAVLAEVGYKTPEKVCDECYARLGFSERRVW